MDPSVPINHESIRWALQRSDFDILSNILLYVSVRVGGKLLIASRMSRAVRQREISSS
jgi:hypothetical protein